MLMSIKLNALKVINIFQMILDLKSVFNCSSSQILQCLLFIIDLSLLMKRIVFIANILYLHGDINSIVSVMFVIDAMIKKWRISCYVYNHWWHLCQWNSLHYFFILLTYLSVRLSWIKVIHYCKYYFVCLNYWELIVSYILNYDHYETKFR
jgi:hypothetical protein